MLSPIASPLDGRVCDSAWLHRGRNPQFIDAALLRFKLETVDRRVACLGDRTTLGGQPKGVAVSQGILMRRDAAVQDTGSSGSADRGEPRSAVCATRTPVHQRCSCNAPIQSVMRRSSGLHHRYAWREAA